VNDTLAGKICNQLLKEGGTGPSIGVPILSLRSHMKEREMMFERATSHFIA
jgi:hypothetical protein